MTKLPEKIFAYLDLGFEQRGQYGTWDTNGMEDEAETHSACYIRSDVFEERINQQKSIPTRGDRGAQMSEYSITKKTGYSDSTGTIHTYLLEALKASMLSLMHESETHFPSKDIAEFIVDHRENIFALINDARELQEEENE